MPFPARPRRAIFQAINALDHALRDVRDDAARESLHEVRDLLARAYHIVNAPTQREE